MISTSVLSLFFVYGKLNEMPVQLLPAAVAEGLIIPLHGDGTARTEVIDTFLTKGFMIKDVFSNRQREPVYCKMNNILQKESDPSGWPEFIQSELFI